MRAALLLVLLTLPHRAWADGAAGLSAPAPARTLRDAPEDLPPFFVQLGGGAGTTYLSDGMPLDGPSPGADPRTTAEEGWAAVWALRLTAGVRVHRLVAVALTVRFQPNSGLGSLANLLVGLRGEALVHRPEATGLELRLHAGLSYGQIQPPANDDGAFVVSGLNGLQSGGTLAYRFTDHAALFVTPELHYLLPSVLLVIEATAGLELSF